MWKGAPGHFRKDSLTQTDDFQLCLDPLCFVLEVVSKGPFTPPSALCFTPPEIRNMITEGPRVRMHARMQTRMHMHACT